MNIVPAIHAEISTLEDALRSDPRFVKLTKLRELQLLYNGDEEEPEPRSNGNGVRHRIAPPAPKKREAKQPRTAKPAKAPKPAKKQKPVAPDAPTDQLDLVYAAMWSLTQKGKRPTYELIQKKTGLNAPQVAAVIKALEKAGRITIHGSRVHRTYELHDDAVTDQELEEHGGDIEPGEAAASAPDAGDEPEFAEVDEGVDDAPPHAGRELKPLPSGFNIDQFKRSDREVLMALLSTGDNAPVFQIAPYADIPEDRVPAVLTSLNAAGITSHVHGKWSLTDFGFAVAKAVHADEH
jgi:hypothetical protein